MYLMRWSVLIPISNYLGLQEQMPEWTFAFLVLSTVFITAAGNVINDYHDAKADRINNPNRVVVDKWVSRRQAMVAHFILNSIGILLGIFVSIYHGIYWLGLIFIGVPVLLWMYSADLKHRLIIGNFAISILTATVPLLVLIFEYPLMKSYYSHATPGFFYIFKPVIAWICCFALFAFLSNLIREIVKDVQDMAGDREAGSKTIALCWGIGTAKWISLIVSVIMLGLLCVLFFVFLNDWISLIFFGLFLVIPIIILIYQLYRVTQETDMKRISYLLKLIMFFGLLYAPVAYFIITNTTG